MSYPMSDSRCRALPEDDRPSLAECEMDVVSAAIGLEIYYRIRLGEWVLPTAGEWARAHAAYDAAIIGDGIVPDEAEMYDDVLRAAAADNVGMSLILSGEDHTITIGEGADRRRMPLPVTVAEDGRQIAEMLVSGSPMAAGLTGMALAEALRSWLTPLARYARGVHR